MTGGETIVTWGVGGGVGRGVARLSDLCLLRHLVTGNSCFPDSDSS